MVKIRHISKKIDITSIYTSDYSAHYSGREIARASKMNHQTALNHINELSSQNLFKWDAKGKNKEYYLDLANPRARILLEMAELYKAFETLKNRELWLLIKELLPFAECIILFGSFANESFTKDSDIDLIIAGKSDKCQIDKIRQRYTRKINAEHISFAEFADSLRQKKPLAVEILKNHVVYGSVPRIVDIFIKWYKK